MLNCTCTGSVHRPTDRYLNRCICMFGVQSPTVSSINCTKRTSPLVLKPDPSVIWERETLPTAFHFLHNTHHNIFLFSPTGATWISKSSAEGAVYQTTSRYRQKELFPNRIQDWTSPPSNGSHIFFLGIGFNPHPAPWICDEFEACK